MSTYTPDLWVVLEFKEKDSEEVNRKVLASWYGGYAGSDSWKLSSGITEIVDTETHHEIHNHSGSVYRCRKDAMGMSGYTTGVYENFVKQLKDKATVELIKL